MTLVFLSHGHSIYTEAANQLLSTSNQSDVEAISRTFDWGKHELFSWQLKGREETVLPINWSYLPRPYPPRNFLYHLPEAVMRIHTTASLKNIAKFSIFKYGIVGLITSLLMIQLIFAQSKLPEARDATSENLWKWISCGFGVLLGSYVIFWSFAGIYDGIALLLIVLALICLKRDQNDFAILCYAAAVFLHFRSLWYFPIGILAIARFYQRDWRAIAPKRRAAVLTLSAFMGGWAIWSFVELLPALRTWPHNNARHLDQILAGNFDWQMWGMLACAGLAMVANRSYLLATCFISALIFIVNTRQVMPWHSMFFYPIILIGLVERSPTAGVLGLVATVDAIFSFFGANILNFPPNY